MAVSECDGCILNEGVTPAACQADEEWAGGTTLGPSVTTNQAGVYGARGETTIRLKIYEPKPLLTPMSEGWRFDSHAAWC
jgi:hypothetical protein